MPTSWTQGFEYKKGDLGRMERCAQTMIEHGITNIAFWGFKGCESLFPNLPEESSQNIWEESGGTFSYILAIDL